MMNANAEFRITSATARRAQTDMPQDTVDEQAKGFVSHGELGSRDNRVRNRGLSRTLSTRPSAHCSQASAPIASPENAKPSIAMVRHRRCEAALKAGAAARQRREGLQRERHDRPPDPQHVVKVSTSRVFLQAERVRIFWKR